MERWELYDTSTLIVRTEPDDDDDRTMHLVLVKKGRELSVNVMDYFDPFDAPVVQIVSVSHIYIYNSDLQRHALILVAKTEQPKCHRFFPLC